MATTSQHRLWRAAVTGVAAILAVLFGAATAASADYQLPTLPHLTAGQAGVLIDNVTPQSWTEHLTAGGFGGRKAPDIPHWFNLSTCQNAAEIYCIAGMSVNGTSLDLVRSVTALDNDPLPISVNNVRTGSISLWETPDHAQHYSVNSYATFTCYLCTTPDVSRLNTDIHAYKTVTNPAYKALSMWDVYGTVKGDLAVSSQKYRDCAWVDQGECGRIVALPTSNFQLSVRLPLHLHTSMPGADLMKAHLNNLLFSESVSGDARLLTVSGTPATIPFFVGTLKPVPSWAEAGKTVLVNPENGMGLPITASGAATGENTVWQFVINAGQNSAPAENCLSHLSGVISAVGGDSPNQGGLSLPKSNLATLTMQDYPKNLNLTPHNALVRFYLREDAAGCFATGNSQNYQTLTATGSHGSNQDGSGTSVAQKMTVISSPNSNWQVLDLTYDNSGSPAPVNLEFSFANSAPPNNPTAIPAPVTVPKLPYTITCTKKVGKKVLSAKVTGLSPVCPKGFKR